MYIYIEREPKSRGGLDFRCCSHLWGGFLCVHMRQRDACADYTHLQADPARKAHADSAASMADCTLGWCMYIVYLMVAELRPVS